MPRSTKHEADVDEHVQHPTTVELLEEDPKADGRLVRKLDRTIFPILYVLYTLSFLDRINISNARIQGMTADLNLTGNRFNIALFVSS
jgi:hypothetical protein